MKRIHKFLLAFSVITVICTPFTQNVSAATFNPNNIIDDTLFNNTSTMTAVQIDAFLNSFPNSCISPNSGFRALDPTGYNATNGYQFGGYVTAGQVIFDSSQAYGLNPQVLLVTLQKEQSLVVGGASYCNDGDEHKYAAAVGYGCPDSGGKYYYNDVNLYLRNGVLHTNVGPTCVNSASKAGFSQQVIRAAWLFKFGQQRSLGNTNWAVIKGNWNNSDDPPTCYGGPMTQGFLSRGCGQAGTYFDGYYPIDGTSVHIESGATAALYWYTPHFSGNQHFFDIFTGWFGSVRSSPFFSVAGRVYLTGADNSYYYVGSQALLDAYGLNSRFGGKIEYVNQGYIANMTYAGNLPWVARFGAGAIYEFDRNGIHHFGDPTIYNAFGYNFDDEAILPGYYANFYTVSTPMAYVVQQFDRPEVYYVSSGKKQHISTQLTYTTQGSPVYSSQAAVQVSSAYANSLPEAAPILSPHETVLNSDTNQLYIWTNGTLQPVNSATASTWGFGVDYARPGSILSLLPIGSATVTSFVTDGSGNKYLLDGGKKLSLSDAQIAQLKVAPTFTQQSSDILGIFGTSSLLPNLRQKQSPAVYNVRSSKLYHVYSETDLKGIGYTQDDVSVLTAQPSSLFTDSGSAVFAVGRLVRIQNTAPVYVIDGDNTMRHVPSEQMMTNFGYTFQSVSVVTTADLSGYTNTSELSQFVKDPLNNTLLVDSGCKYVFTSGLMTTYNFNSTQFVNAPAKLLDRAKDCGNQTTLIRSSSQFNVYKIESGTKRWIMSQDAFTRNGFSWSDVLILSPTFVNSIASGANIP